MLSQTNIVRSSTSVRDHRSSAMVHCDPTGREPFSINAEDAHRGSVLHCIPLAIALMIVAGCSKPQPTEAKPKEPPPIPVDVANVIVRPQVDYREYSGRTRAVNSVDIRARVSGYLLQTPLSEGTNRIEPSSDSSSPSAVNTNVDSKGNASADAQDAVNAREGDFVEQGTLLFQIDPTPYQLALQQASGNLDAAKARAEQAKQDLDRARDLFSSNTLSKAEYDQAIAAKSAVDGQIANLEAIVKRARVDLAFTRVESPIAGLLGQNAITVGNLVVADTTILTNVVARSPIYVLFDVDEQSVLDYRQRTRQGEVQSARDIKIPIQMRLANEAEFKHEGYIDFVDNQTDPSTGNTRLRGVFDNASNELSPGLFARVRVPFTAQYDAILVPTVALASDQEGRFVMVVEGNKVQRRAVELGDTYGDTTVVRKGLKATDQVVTSGLQKIRPGSVISFEEKSKLKTSSQSPDSKTSQVPEQTTAPDIPSTGNQSAGDATNEKAGAAQ